MNTSGLAKKLGAGLLTVLACATSAQAVVTYNDNVTPAAIFGAGNANGSFTVDRQNGIELGLRGKVRYPVPSNTFNSNGDGTYTFKAGVFNGVNNPQWHFEWSINSDYTGGTGKMLGDYTYRLEMDFDPGPGTNFLAWDQVSYPTSAIPFTAPVTPPFYDHSVGTNATGAGAGVEASTEPQYAALLAANNVAQNSWRYPFYSAAPFLFDANATGVYDIRLTAFEGVTEKAQVTIRIQVEGFVTPEVILGTGNVNGNFTLDRSNGVELGLRGKVRFPTPANVYNNNYDGSYTFLAGVFNGVENPQWNFEWTVNTDYTGLTGKKLSDYTYLLELDFDPGAGTDFLSWDHISYPTSAIPYDVPVTPPFYDHSIGTNATANGAGVEASTEPQYAALVLANNVAQNSWRYTFYDGAPFFFNAATIGRYDIRLTAFDGVNVAAQVTAQIKVVESGTCFVDSACDDGLACNGVETCNLTTNECEFGTAVDCSGLDDQCNVGTCVDPAGTCVATPLADGTVCDDGDTCSVTDSCQTGACTAGGGGDTDSDGTCDLDDLCPADPLKVALGVCGCAVADTDTDGDLAADCIETCDTDPLKTAPGACGCGVPDTDTDGDLTADCNDLCPLDAPKVAPGQCGCAVADTDTDADLVADCNDLCPTDALKVAPGQCGCSVADTDTDADLTADCNDNCPAVPNADQADVDNDGDGNACDSNDGNGTLAVSQVVIKAANPDTGATGRIRVAAVIVDGPTGGGLQGDLFLGDVVVELTAGAFTSTAPLGTCTTAGNRIKCRNDAAGVRALFSPVNQGSNTVPDMWKMQLTQRGIASSADPSAPAVVVLSQPTPSITRSDDISACDAKPRNLRCAED